MEKKHSHLTLDERIVIEQGIKRKMSFSAIAASIGKDRSTVSREVQRNRKRYPGSAFVHNSLIVSFVINGISTQL